MRNRVVWVTSVAALIFCVPLSIAGRPGGGGTATSSTVLNLGVLPGDVVSRAFGVSDVGGVVGHSVHYVTVTDGRSPFYQAFYWNRNYGLHALPTNHAAGGAERQSHAYAVAGSVSGSEFVVGEEKAVGEMPHAVIWTSPQLSTPAVLLEDDWTQLSAALGVNELGVAVGQWGDYAAIWVADPKETDGYARTDFSIVAGVPNVAKDVNNDGEVVGYSDLSLDQPLAFVRLANGEVHALPSVGTDAYSGALAVSNEFDTTVGVRSVKAVYVAGWTQSATGVQRAVRWLVNVETGAVVSTMLLSKEWASGVNSAGDVLCNYGTGSKPTLFRNNAYYSLKPPRGASGAGANALAGPVSSTTYAAGVAFSQQVDSERAVVWTIR